MRSQKGTLWVSADKAVGALAPGQRFSLPLCCGMPQTLMEALVADSERLKGMEVVSGLQVAYPFLADGLEESFTFRTWQCAPAIRKQLSTGRVKYIPMRQGDAVRVFGAGGSWPLDAVLLQVAPPDENGYCSLGVSIGHSLPLALEAKLVIAEVNQRMPRLPGPGSIHISQIDYMVESDRKLLEFPSGDPPGPKEIEIGRLAADLIPDGATIQVGLGAIPEAILDSLTHKRNLKFWAMGGDKMVDLAQSGALAQGPDPAITVTETLGSTKVFQFMDQNPLCQGRDLPSVINARVIAQIPRFCSILSALEIDLTGQVNAETIKGQQFSAVGGSFDFLQGSLFSPGGVSIIALPATTPGDKVSRIVAQLPAGSAVTTPRHSVRYVITEFGVADLWGRSLGERARALASIAHPAFREDLQRQAAQMA